MGPDRSDDDTSDDLPPAEAARDRRRDHDAAAAARSGMRTGLAKQFKQVLDAQLKRTRSAGSRAAAEGAAENDDPSEPPPRKRGHRGHGPRHPAPPD